MNVKNQMMQGQRGVGLKNTAFKTVLGIGAAAAIALSSYSLGTTTGSTAVQDSHGEVQINPALVSNAAKNSDGTVGSAKVSDPHGVPVSVIIGKSKNTDPAGFAARLNTLKSSPEFSSFLISHAGSVEECHRDHIS